MAAILDYVMDVECRITESGTEIVREKGISAASLKEAIDNKMIPEYGTRHPDFPALRLVSGSVTQKGNDNGMWQGFWQGTYASKDKSVTPQPDVDPWTLGAQEYNSTPFPIEIPMLGGFDVEGVYHQLCNTAGSRIQRNHTIYGVEHKFLFCRENKGTKPTFNRHAIVNSASVTIAGVSFAQHEALLMPPVMRSVVEYTDSGDLKRKYWEISVTIKEHPLTWITKSLNVGTMARFKDDSGTLSEIAEPIYKYFPWEHKEPEKNFEIKPVFGSIRDVSKAKHQYAVIVAGAAKNDAYYKAYKELPWEEVTESLPLDLDGCVYLAALKDPVNYPYYVVDLFDTDLGDLKQYSFPSKREGD